VRAWELAGLVADEDRLTLIGRDPELRGHAYELRRRLGRIGIYHWMRGRELRVVRVRDVPSLRRLPD
jgi:hypothetical protein